MKNVVALLSLLFASFFAAAQGGTFSKIPDVDIKTLQGEIINASSLSNEGKPMVISFWATWCKPCIRELSAIHDQYPDWVEQTGVKIIAVSIDDARNSAKVLPFISGQGWEYDVYLDENSDFRRLLNVNNIPHTFLLNGNGEIVWQHSGYAAGDEDTLFELVQKLAQGLPIESH